jgi:hypothetical protein
MCVPCAVTGDFAEDDAAADRAARRDRLLRRLGLKGTPADDPEPSQSDLGVSVSLAEGSEVEGGLAERSTMSFALSAEWRYGWQPSAHEGNLQRAYLCESAIHSRGGCVSACECQS